MTAVKSKEVIQRPGPRVTGYLPDERVMEYAAIYGQPTAAKLLAMFAEASMATEFHFRMWRELR